MTDLKNRFIELSRLSRLETAEIAALLGKSLRSVESWRRPADPRSPSKEAVDRMETIYLDRLREEVRAAGFDLIRLKR